MKVSSKQLFFFIAILALLLATFEFVTNEFSIDGLFSVYYCLPIALFAIVLFYTLQENHLNLITIFLYLAILLLTIASVIHVFTVISVNQVFAFDGDTTSIPTTTIIAVVLNISTMILTILQFIKHTKQQKSVV